MRTAQPKIAKSETARPKIAKSGSGSRFGAPSGSRFRSPEEILVEKIHVEARALRRRLVKLHGPNKASGWYGGVLEVLAHFETYGRLPKRDVMYEFEEIGWKWARKEILKAIH